MTSPQKLSFEQLLDWLEGRLSVQDAEKFAAQMANADADTQAEVAWLRAFLRLGEEIVLESPPQHVHQSLLQSFAEQVKPRPQLATPPPATTKAGFFQRLLGVLTFDSHGQLGLAGVRGTARQDTRQLIYNGTVADVALNLHLDSKKMRFNLLGQLLPTSVPITEPFSVQILQDETEVGITMADELGEFSFSNLALGEYQLVVSTNQCDIVIAPLSFQEG